MKICSVFGLTAAIACLSGIAQAENIVANGDFYATTDWTISSPYTVGLGYGSLYMDAGNWGYQLTSHTIEADENFHVSWDARTEQSGTTPNAMEARLFYYDGGSAVVLDSQQMATTYTYATSTFDFTAQQGETYIGKAIGIWLVNHAPAGSWASFTNVSIDVTTVPEPSTFLLVATGVFGLLAYAWQRRR